MINVTIKNHNQPLIYESPVKMISMLLTEHEFKKGDIIVIQVSHDYIYESVVEVAHDGGLMGWDDYFRLSSDLMRASGSQFSEEDRVYALRTLYHRYAYRAVFVKGLYSGLVSSRGDSMVRDLDYPVFNGVSMGTSDAAAHLSALNFGSYKPIAVQVNGGKINNLLPMLVLRLFIEAIEKIFSEPTTIMADGRAYIVDRNGRYIRLGQIIYNSDHKIPVLKTSTDLTETVVQSSL